MRAEPAATGARRGWRGKCSRAVVSRSDPKRKTGRLARRARCNRSHGKLTREITALAVWSAATKLLVPEPAASGARRCGRENRSQAVWSVATKKNHITTHHYRAATRLFAFQTSGSVAERSAHLPAFHRTVCRVGLPCWPRSRDPADRHCLRFQGYSVKW